MEKKTTQKKIVPLFETLSAINVNSKTEKKKNLTYLSWAWAWSEFKKSCPNAKYEIVKDPETNKPYMVDDFGILVQTKVTVNDETHEMWLPVMDGANKAMNLKPYTYTTKYGDKQCAGATMFDINKALMRCLVKNLAMFGLGIYIYAGEDLPDGEEPEPIAPPAPIAPPEPIAPPVKKPIDDERFANALKAITDGTFSEDKMNAKFSLSRDQITLLNNHMIQMEQDIEDLAKSIEEPEEIEPEEKKKKATKATKTDKK